MPKDPEWTASVVSWIREREQGQTESAARFRAAAEPMLEAMEEAGIDTTDFGKFGWASGTRFDFESAVPIIIEWLPDHRVQCEECDGELARRTAVGEG